jgi:hypothetical protein
MDDWDLFEAIDIEDLSSIITLGAVGEARDLREESGTSEPILSGADYLRDLLNCGNHKRIYSVLRMQKDTFDKFCSWIRRGGHLKDSKKVMIEQQVAMFLPTVSGPSKPTIQR